MRGQPPSGFSIDVLTRAVLEEFPELDGHRVRTAIERGVSRALSANLDTEGYRVVDLHLQRAEDTEEASERAAILRELATTLEQRSDADRAFVVRLAAFAAAPAVADIDPLLRGASITTRWSELPLDAMSAMIDPTDGESPRRLRELANAWQQVGRHYYAADCLERVLVIEPSDALASEQLEVFYRANREWPVLVDLLGRRAVHVATDRERSEIYREIGELHERELSDEAGALDAYREADRLDPDREDALSAIARLASRLALPEEEQLEIAERLGRVTTDPRAQAVVLCRAAELARTEDWDKAQGLFERARVADPDLPAAVDGLAVLMRDRGELAAAAELLVRAADRPGLHRERSRWLADAGDFRVGLGDFEHAKELYRDARRADPTNHRAGVALVELCWDTGSLVELAPILDELCRTTDDPDRLRQYLIQRSKVAVELGESTSAKVSLARAVDLDPENLTTRRELADLLFESQEWARARPLLEGLLDDEDLLPEDTRVDLHYRIARAAHELGDGAAAAKHAAIALALAPEHRPSLLLRAELDSRDPEALLADQLALANSAPLEERALRFAALGDRYVERGDRATAREMYREALSYKPADHMLLTKSLALVADDGDWSYSLDLLQRLIDSESDHKVRARYRHASAQIARDELADPDDAIAHLEHAIVDDPLNFTAADDLEALLTAHRDSSALMEFYYRRLEHVRDEEGRPGERLRLWDKLAAHCRAAGRLDDAVVALEVALELDASNHERRCALADLYLVADPKHAHTAIVQHHAVLRGDKRRAESYRALAVLYERTQQPYKARAALDAIAALEAHVDGESATTAAVDPTTLEAQLGALFQPAPRTASDVAATLASLPPPIRAGTLTNDDWLAVAKIDVDLQLSGLFALVAPPFAAERARMRPPPPPSGRDQPPSDPIAAVLDSVIDLFGIARPAVVVDREQLVPARVAIRVHQGALVPVLTVAAKVDDDPSELAFGIARQLADLRTDRIARLLCPRPGELAQIVEIALAEQRQDSHAARWLASALHPVELEQVRTIGRRLRERAVNPMTAAVGWLAATERAADRIGLVASGNLAACLRVVDRAPQGSLTDLDRGLELIWASVTEELLAVRGRLEGWGATTRKSGVLSSVMEVR